MELAVKLPMVLQCDNKGACDLANNWSAGGRTRHTAVKIMFLRELKEEGLLVVERVTHVCILLLVVTIAPSRKVVYPLTLLLVSMLDA